MTMEKENHTDGNGDSKCDACGYQLTGNAPGGNDTTQPGGDDGDGGSGDNAYVIWIIVGVILVLSAIGIVAFVFIKKKEASV